MTNRLTKATEDQVTQLRRHAVNDVTREIMRDGVLLTEEQIAAVGGEETVNWMCSRLGLNYHPTNRGIEFTPPVHYLSADRLEKVEDAS